MSAGSSAISSGARRARRGARARRCPTAPRRPRRDKRRARRRASRRSGCRGRSEPSNRSTSMRPEDAVVGVDAPGADRRRSRYSAIGIQRAAAGSPVAYALHAGVDAARRGIELEHLQLRLRARGRADDESAHAVGREHELGRPRDAVGSGRRRRCRGRFVRRMRGRLGEELRRPVTRGAGGERQRGDDGERRASSERARGRGMANRVSASAAFARICRVTPR